MITKNITYRTRQNILDIKKEFTAHDPKKTLIQAFCGILDFRIIEKLRCELRELFPDTPFLGMSTAGEILEGLSHENSILLSFSFFSDTTVKSVLCEQNDDLYEEGRKMGQALKQSDTQAVILFGCGLKNGKFINSEPLLSGIQDETGEIMIAGGQAGDNGAGKTTFVFTEKGLTEEGAAAVSLNSRKLRAGHAFNLSWIPLGKKLAITGARGNRVREIDGQTPFNLYTHYLGEEIARDLPLAGAEFPLMIERKGLQVAIHPMKIHSDGSFDYIHDFKEGEKVRFSYCNAGLISLEAERIHREIAAEKPETLFIYSCVSRKWVLGEDILMDLNAVKGLGPCAGGYCYGEYYIHENGNTFMFSQTQTVLTLSEEELKEEREDHTGPGFSEIREESRQFRTMRVLHRLVETSTREIESINRELVSLSRMDSLTGLANRRYFDTKLKQELKRHSRSKSPLSLILIDVDYFKKYNDTYGHVAGDECLKIIGKIIKQTISRPDDLAARFGGEEFICILSNTGREGALFLAEKILQEIRDKKVPHEASEISPYLSISLGVETIYCDKVTLASSLLRTCDTLLYRAKEKGRNRIESDEPA